MKWGFKVYKSAKFETHEENDYYGRALFKFPNGYGASVICNKYSYGGTEGLFELAVMRFDGKGRAHFCYTTPITGNVEGYLESVAVDDLLTKISQL